jgi:hypothetical protein
MSLSDTKISNENAVVYNIAQRYISYFFSRGYELSDVQVKEHKVIPQRLSLQFINEKIETELYISFFPAITGHNGAFTVMISKPVNQCLALSDYLKIHHRDDLLPYFTYHDSNTDIAVFADAFFKMLMELFDTDLKPIVDGTTFETTPIDWQGYK